MAYTIITPPQTNGRYKNGTHQNGHKNGKAPQPDKLQPHNVEAEEAILGALLIDPDAIIRVSNFLMPEDFFLQRHTWIYDVILELHRERKPTDYMLVIDELERRGQLNDTGGPAYLTDLINLTPTSINAEHYGRIVERTATLRRLIDGATEIAQLAYADNTAADEVMDRAESIIFGISEKRSNKDLKPLSASMNDFYDGIEYRSQHRGELLGIPTGLKDLDRLLGGLQKSDLIVMAGRPGMGKTSLALSIALCAGRKWDKRVAMFSLEMSDKQLLQRLVSAESGIDSQKLKRGDLSEEDWPVFIQATSVLNEAPIFIDDTAAISVLELRTKARRMQAEHGLDLLIVDYLQLMRGDGRSENRQQEISYISGALKALAKELNIPVLTLSQLSRACENRHDKRPLLSDLRESGAIEQDADIVMFVYRDEVYNPDSEFPNVAEIITSKHRNGPTGIFSVYFKKSVTQFVDLEVRTQALDYE